MKKMWEINCITCGKLIDRYSHILGDYHAPRLCQCLTNLSIDRLEHPENYSPKRELGYYRCPA